MGTMSLDTTTKQCVGRSSFLAYRRCSFLHPMLPFLSMWWNLCRHVCKHPLYETGGITCGSTHREVRHHQDDQNLERTLNAGERQVRPVDSRDPLDIRLRTLQLAINAEIVGQENAQP